MKKMLILFLIFLTLPAFADVFDHKAHIQNFVNKIPELTSRSCKFSQIKTFTDSKTKIESGGNFKFEKEKGFIFNFEYPVKSTIDYTFSDYKQVSSIFKAISDKKYFTLEKEFDLYFEEQGQSWTLGLIPKDGTKTKNYLNFIKIQGKNIVSFLEIDTKTNNTQIKFF